MCEFPAWLFALPEWVRPFMVSDVCSDGQSLGGWLTLLFAHFGIGVALGIIPRRIGLAVFAAWIGKEIAADMTIAGWSVAVVADSAVDLAAGWVGLAVGQNASGNIPAIESAVNRLFRTGDNGHPNTSGSRDPTRRRPNAPQCRHHGGRSKCRCSGHSCVPRSERKSAVALHRWLSSSLLPRDRPDDSTPGREGR